MATPLQKGIFIAAAAIAAAAEGVVVYEQWPAPPLKVCASVELGELLAAAARTETELHEARGRLRFVQDDSATKDVMRLEAASASASTAVAVYKQKAKERQTARGGAARDGACN
jgi:hypothetical protein